MSDIGPVSLTLKSSFAECKTKGDYAWEANPRNLFLCCPFCGLDAPLPVTTPVENEEPLTVRGIIQCGFCDVWFSLKDGKAYKNGSDDQARNTL